MRRRKIPYRVCSCTPSGVVTHLETRLLKDLVNREIHPIRCVGNCKRKFMKGMRLGDLCAETGHFWLAKKVWELTETLIVEKDWNDWRYVCFDNDRVRLRDVVSDVECELLSRRRSDLWRILGFRECAGRERAGGHAACNTSASCYEDLWAEKYGASI